MAHRDGQPSTRPSVTRAAAGQRRGRQWQGSGGAAAGQRQGRQRQGFPGFPSATAAAAQQQQQPENTSVSRHQRLERTQVLYSATTSPASDPWAAARWVPARRQTEVRSIVLALAPFRFPGAPCTVRFVAGDPPLATQRQPRGCARETAGCWGTGRSTGRSRVTASRNEWQTPILSSPIPTQTSEPHADFIIIRNSVQPEKSQCLPTPRSPTE